MKNLLCSIVATVALCVSAAFASDQAVFPPNRPPDYATATDWMQPNIWEFGSQTSANALTYRVAFKAIPAPDPAHPEQTVVAQVIQQKLEYGYWGAVTVGHLPPAPNGPNFMNVATNSWNAFWLAHDPNVIGGASVMHPDVPFPPGAAWPFNGLSVGGGGAFMTLGAGQSALLENAPGAIVVFEQPVAAPFPYMTHATEDLAPFREIDGYRGQIAIHNVFVTPVSDPSWSYGLWYPQPPGSTYVPSVNYNGTVKERATFKVWWVRAGDPPLVFPYQG